MGVKIDCLLVDILELSSSAQFAPKADRVSIIRHAITRNDTLKYLLYMLFELKGMEERYFIELAPKLEEVGRMLYGWHNKLMRENRPIGRKQE